MIIGSVALDALTFTITTREADMLGLAVICPDARYASVQLAGVRRLIRRHASPVQWTEIERLIASGVHAGPLTSGVFHQVLTGGDPDKVVEFVHSLPVEAEPLATVEVLDLYLKNQPIELQLGLQQDDEG